ncbi:MAG: hypothetical protein QW794_06765 [Thermosphaera sp.]
MERRRGVGGRFRSVCRWVSIPLSDKDLEGKVREYQIHTFECEGYRNLIIIMDPRAFLAGTGRPFLFVTTRAHAEDALRELIEEKEEEERRKRYFGFIEEL